MPWNIASWINLYWSNPSWINLYFAAEIIFSKPDLTGILQGYLPKPDVVRNPEMLYIAIAILGATVMPHNLLIASQVVLSLQLFFAVIPLVMFTSDLRLMGKFVNPAWLKLLAGAIATIIISLNAWLLWQTFLGWL